MREVHRRCVQKFCENFPSRNTNILKRSIIIRKYIFLQLFPKNPKEFPFLTQFSWINFIKIDTRIYPKSPLRIIKKYFDANEINAWKNFQQSSYRVTWNIMNISKQIRYPSNKNQIKRNLKKGALPLLLTLISPPFSTTRSRQGLITWRILFR